MALPVLIAIEDNAEVLARVENQLVQRYGRDYEIRLASSPDDARKILSELRESGSDVALVLAGHTLPGMTGGELLDEVRSLHPQAKRALLVPEAAWASGSCAEEIRASMALGRADHYVLTPADSVDEVFHEAVSDFLLEWARESHLVPQTVHIVGESWSGRAQDLRDTFARCAVPHEFCLADSPRGRELLADLDEEVKLPLMLLPDGRVLSDPSDAEIASAAGAPIDIDERSFDVLVVGAGPAGLSAAVYGASEGLGVLVVDSGGIGGQARSSSLIRNYLGFGKGISGARLAEEAYEQAWAFGATFLFMHKVTKLQRSDDWFVLSLADGRLVSARVVILATGASYRRLGIDSLEELTGSGVFYGGPASEASALAGKNVYVVGGGNSAAQAALHLARYARRVTMLVRGPSLAAGMSHYLIQALEGAPSIEVRTEATIVGGGGDARLERLVIRDGAGEEQTVPADALFVLIGARPQTDWLPDEVARDSYGFVLTGDDVEETWMLRRRPLSLETSMPGVLAAGDIRHGSVKRVAAAVGEGSIAVQLVHKLLAEIAEPAVAPS